MKDGTVLVYFCPVMGGHLFLDENLGTVVVVVQYSCVFDVFERRDGERAGAGGQRSRGAAAKVQNTRQDLDASPTGNPAMSLQAPAPL